MSNYFPESTNFSEIDLSATKITFVVSKFNEDIVSKLLDTAEKRLLEIGINKKNINKLYVPGAFEIPFAVKKSINELNNQDAIICLGSIIRGETSHYELISDHVFSSLASLNISSKIPIINGILTTENIDQAEKRIVNGKYYAETCIEMIAL
ncbi:MAG: 6,7-dimethyl-8-ribityllumazine synthase [Chloroflexota bacterium]|nr:6,7-dimethyl-8-ribityllumazine synthase [Chloroflexota bacterium]|tara:strand:- start:97 stop:552 length:456 start_codon:yes stop_codon:yes gene_type:complete